MANPAIINFMIVFYGFVGFKAKAFRKLRLKFLSRFFKLIYWTVYENGPQFDHLLQESLYLCDRAVAIICWVEDHF